MTNKEYYKEQILDIACSGAAIAVDKATEEIASCGYIYGDGSITCEQCLFNLNDRGECEEKCKEWCASEHIERPKLTKNEKMFLSLLKEKWKYMVRDQNGDLFICDTQPIKDIDVWDQKKCNWVWIDDRLLDSCKFTMVKWEDEEPWSIEDLNKLPVKEEEN